MTTKPSVKGIEREEGLMRAFAAERINQDLARNEMIMALVKVIERVVGKL